jgi:hypothetical protein
VPSSRSLVAELLADLRGAFGALGARWYLFGAQAAIVHGAARLTADVDVTVDLAARSSAELVNALAAAGFEPRVPDPGGVVETTRVLPLVHKPTRIPVDVVLAGPGLEDLFFARVEEHAIGGVPVPVASAEDVLTMKVLAARPKDLDDAEAVIRAHGPRLDVERIRSTLRLLEAALDRRDLLSELERLLGRAGRA